MTGAMYSAVSGLKAHMGALNVIGNNIANVNTNAYKASRFTFLESIYSTVTSGSNGNSVSGGINPAQVGYGASLGTIDLDMSTKNYTPTGVGLDCMIDGDGFFLVGDKGLEFNNSNDLTSVKLTRLGNFGFDSDGYLVDGQGNHVYGFLQVNGGTPDDPKISSVLTEIRLPIANADGEPLYPTVNGHSIKDAGNTGDKRVLMDSISISSTGQITGVTNGEAVLIGYVAIGKVDNPAGVTHNSGPYYSALGGAGSMHLTTIDPSVLENDSNIKVANSGNTSLIGGGLESSGTDLATEITSMITVQRGYQANTRIVTVTDSMIEELVNMKR